MSRTHHSEDGKILVQVGYYNLNAQPVSTPGPWKTVSRERHLKVTTRQSRKLERVLSSVRLH